MATSQGKGYGTQSIEVMSSSLASNFILSHLYMFTCMPLIITYHVSLINHKVPSEELLYERDGINK